MTARLFDGLQVLLAAAEAVCKGDKRTSLKNPIKIQKGTAVVSYFILRVKRLTGDVANPLL